MSNKQSLFRDVAVHDLLVIRDLEVSPDSTSGYIQVNAQEEWDSFLSIINK